MSAICEISSKTSRRTTHSTILLVLVARTATSKVRCWSRLAVRLDVQPAAETDRGKAAKSASNRDQAQFEAKDSRVAREE